jgi:hypothetical protein
MSTTLKTAAARKATDPLPFNRRRSDRKPHVAEAWIASPTATTPDDRAEVSSLNISRHGVAFESNRPMPVDTFFVIEIGVGDQRLCSEVRIISCRKNDAGAYEVGAEFC